ncbi:hypothetical protein NEOLEDRAFT_1241144 [Neolentinus lepideus HHB14362 ss-1]|uniref:Fe2OG dioxygenase domain-containing protein n=1 Tax=Neolentinus lepideus HHB14362 ss-1 TaxID=1314782 RepID=A0A165T7Z2_9AGAM|nr:hypothetical protein NEOLEDRAFT_1241144 [Neolentinus lepideus HHB14362 ss-1]
MAKRAKRAPGSSKAPISSLPPPIFPPIKSKKALECTALLQDQILLLDNFLTHEECKRYIAFIDSLPLELTPPKKKGEAERVNYRISITSQQFAQDLYDAISPHLPQFPYPSFDRRAREGISRPIHSLNSNIRLYKYTANQYFGPHYDDSVQDPQTGAKSEWTLLVYLSGVEDSVEGGETLFYKEQKGKPTQTVVPPLNRGTALLHRHGQECMLHEGSPVRKGTKYVLRSDLMFVH